MEPHGSNCGWFWAWTIAGFGLALGFLAIFSIGPLLLAAGAGVAAFPLLRRPAGAPISR